MFLLAKVPGGVIAIFEFGPAYFPVLKELTMSNLKPARSDLTIEFSMSADELESIRRQANEQRKSDFTLTADPRDVSGLMVAQCVASYQLRSKGLLLRPPEN